MLDAQMAGLSFIYPSYPESQPLQLVVLSAGFMGRRFLIYADLPKYWTSQLNSLDASKISLKKHSAKK